jgi:hypothetical protein
MKTILFKQHKNPLKLGAVSTHTLETVFVSDDHDAIEYLKSWYIIESDGSAGFEHFTGKKSWITVNGQAWYCKALLEAITSYHGGNVLTDQMRLTPETIKLLLDGNHLLQTDKPL